MRTRELSAILAVADKLHFSRAAESLGLAQPQLSALIKRIEDEAGFAIFRRRPRVSVTQAGEVLVTSARRVRAELERAHNHARAVAAGRAGEITLGFVPVAMASHLPAMLKGFVELNPDVHVDLVEGTTSELHNQLRKGDLDLVITRAASNQGSAQRIKFAHDEVNLMLPSTHELASRDTVQPNELEHENLIIFPRTAGPEYYDQLMAWCRAAGWSPTVDREVESWFAVAALVGAGVGISLGTQLLSRISVPGVTYRPIVGTPHDVSFFMTLSSERLSPAGDRFIQYVEEFRSGFGTSCADTNCERLS
jgi:DNA-binding transcriptional LysR family regulator